MPKSIQLQVPKPCHANWNEMEKTDKGRFCLSCQKQVVDFSLMNDQQILKYISTTKGNLCGHFYPDQLNRDISMKQQRKLSWFRYFIHVMIPALVIVNRTSAQEKFKGDTVVCVSTDTKSPVDGKLALKEKKKGQYDIKGKVIDQHGEPVFYATIMIKGTKKGTAADNNGSFRIDINNNANIILVVSAIGYETKEVIVSNIARQNSELLTIPMNVATMGDLVVVGYTVKKTIDTSLFRKIKNMLVAPEKINDTVKIFPNPVSSGSQINVSFDVNKTGEYIVTMINISGQTVMQKNIEVNKSKQIEQIQCDDRLPKGIYTIQVTNSSTRKIYNNKMLVL